MIDLPPNFVIIGLGSKLSMWLTPPFMKSQITLLALGAKCGSPLGGDHAAVLARASRLSMAPSAMPVNPIPMSAKNVRRGRCLRMCSSEQKWGMLAAPVGGVIAG